MGTSERQSIPPCTRGKNASRTRYPNNGNSIQNAVAVANIITEKMLKGVTKIEKINLDTLEKAGIGKMTSTVEIIINKF